MTPIEPEDGPADWRPRVHWGLRCSLLGLAALVACPAFLFVPELLPGVWITAATLRGLGFLLCAAPEGAGRRWAFAATGCVAAAGVLYALSPGGHPLQVRFAGSGWVFDLALPQDPPGVAAVLLDLLSLVLSFHFLHWLSEELGDRSAQDDASTLVRSGWVTLACLVLALLGSALQSAWGLVFALATCALLVVVFLRWAHLLAALVQRMDHPRR